MGYFGDSTHLLHLKSFKIMCLHINIREDKNLQVLGKKGMYGGNVQI
jgi:hypothetical protein